MALRIIMAAHTTVVIKTQKVIPVAAQDVRASHELIFEYVVLLLS